MRTGRNAREVPGCPFLPPPGGGAVAALGRAREEASPQHTSAPTAPPVRSASPPLQGEVWEPRLGEPLSILGIRYLNARPLLAGLEEGIEAPFPYRFATAEPADCAETLATGRAAAALVPVAALPRLARARVVTSLGVACRGQVTSVLLVTTVPPGKIRRLAAHTASITSVALARLLLAERWHTWPTVVSARPPLASMLAQADAAVLIGDPALSTVGNSGCEEIDLGLAWQEWTGLPFVFAVWGVRRDAPPAVDALLHASLACAEANWERLLPAWAAAHAQEVHRVRAYLQERLHFRLDAEDLQAVDEFLRRAGDAGLLPGGRQRECGR
ncbi:MAG: menaquinone biosynthesis protein [Thermoanaerobaculaceae bacterium]|nr:menaquinone biosynthesis protein [Thermoanaerobaculaceae bacterium]